MRLYDENFNEINVDDLNQSNIVKHFIKNLQSGVYYLSVTNVGRISDTVSLKIQSRNTIYLGSGENDILINTYNNITSANSHSLFTIILNQGTYYIGYSGNLDNGNVQFLLRRKVNSDLNTDDILVTDPTRNQNVSLGSEVTFNNGELLGNTITEGFTRNIYLMVDGRQFDAVSRLDYDWYSSNEDVAKVTKYGTVLALNVTENTSVTIYAINKYDPSIVYKKDFIIQKETKTDQITIECNMSYSYSKENGIYTLELDFTNSPYPMIQYYNWGIYVPCQENEITVSMNNFGRINSSGLGYAILTGIYTFNPRITIIINLVIV